MTNKPPNNNEIPSVSWSGSPERGQDSGELPQVKAYEIIKKLGEGGMGIVYLAEQKEPIKRQVALKIIKPGMDSAKVIARFEAERQTLALLDHPSIARVFDAGTTKLGRPYFAMEYVKGIPITEYCDFKKLSIEERLQLLMQVCQAIQHAHQKGIIHRDIKPSNILVYADNGRAIPKVIDFGVAKALSQQLTERTMFTEEGQLIGTPEYMSPEQTDLASHDIDTRTDIYSLGVLLYELLTGVLPFDPKALRQAAFEEIQRIIREQDPPRPSTKLSSLGEEAEEIVQKRQTELPALIKRLYKELEWIPLKAMRKERSYRYQSASELAEDIQNYLNGSPLIAGPESVSYRLKKAIRRHRALVGGVAAVMVVLIAGIVASTIFAIEAKQEALRAKEEAETSRRALYVNRIALAEKKINEGESVAAQALLNECDPDLRSWEWEWLNYLSQRILATMDLDEECYSVAFDPNGNRIALVHSGSVRIWDLESNCEVLALPFNSSPRASEYTRVKFSPDGTIIACLNRGSVQRWDVLDGREILRFSRGDSRSIYHGDLVFLPDGRCIAVIPDSGSGVWDVESGEKLADFSGHDSLMEFAPDGKTLAVLSANDPCSFYLWDVHANAKSLVFKGHSDRITCFGFSPDGSFIATGCEDGSIKIWNTKTGIETTTLYGHNGPITQIMFSPDGTVIASAARHVVIGVSDGIQFDAIPLSIDQSIRIWDVQTWRTLTIFQNPEGPVQHMAYSPDGNRLVSINSNLTAHLLDVSPRPQVLLQKNLGSKRFSNAMGVWWSTCNGDTIISSSRYSLNIVSTATGAILSRINGVSVTWGDRGLFAISRDGKKLLAVAGEELRQWNLGDTQDSSLVQIKIPDPEDIIQIAFGNQGRKIYWVSNQTISVVDADTYRILAEVRAPTHSVFTGPVADIGGGRIVVGACEPDATEVYKYTFDYLLIFDVKMKRQPAVVWDPNMTGPSILVTSEEDWLIAVIVQQPDKDLSYRDSFSLIKQQIFSQARFWRIDDEQGLGEYEDSEILNGWILAVSPDTRRVTSVDIPFHNDGTVRILDPRTGVEILNLKQSIGRISAAAFSPDGRQIATSNAEGSIVLWGPTPTQRW